MTILIALSRWAHLFALMALFGAAAFCWLLQRDALPRPGVSRGWLIATAVAAASALAQYLLTAANLGGAFDPVVLSTIVQHTLFGQVFVIRALALAALVALTARGNPALLPTGLAAGLALACVAFTSHAAASGSEQFAPLRVTTDAIHLLTGGFWIGGLAVLLRLARSRGSLHAPVNLFSEIALYAVTALALAGMINAGFVFSAQRVNALYLVVLAGKVALALAMVFVAFLNRLRVMPALEQDKGAQTLARNVRVELILACCVVALAAVLGSISPG